MPAMRQRPAFSEDGTLWRLHRLLKLSRVQFHTADHTQHGWCSGQESAWRRPADGTGSNAARRPLRTLSAARRASEAAEGKKGREKARSRKAQAREHSEGRSTRRYRSRKGARAAV